jgi:hypothetical protein
MTRSMSVSVTNGASVICSSQFQQVQWEIQGYVFAGDLKVLPLKY